MQDEYLTRCVVDPLKRTVYLYSSEGSEKEVSCDTTEEFMNVLDYVRLFYSKMNLPEAAKHCGMSLKEMKLTFFEFLKYNPITYKG